MQLLSLRKWRIRLWHHSVIHLLECWNKENIKMPTYSLTNSSCLSFFPTLIVIPGKNSLSRIACDNEFSRYCRNIRVNGRAP